MARYFTGTKIVAVAKNYALHLAEMRALEAAAGVAGAPPPPAERPVFFFKPSTSALLPGGGPIVRPARCADLHHAVELGVVISRACRRARAADWQNYVEGYVVALDMTARDLQAQAKKAGQPWTLGKCWDSFTPMGPILPAARPCADEV